MNATSMTPSSPLFSARFCTKNVAKGIAGTALVAGGAVSLATLTAHPIGAQAIDPHSVPAHSAPAHDPHGGGHGPAPEQATNYLNNTAIATVLSGPMALGSCTLGKALTDRTDKVADPQDTVELPSQQMGVLKAQLNAATQAHQALEKQTSETLKGDLKRVFGGVSVESILTGLFQEKPHEAHHQLAEKLHTNTTLKKAYDERRSLAGDPHGLIAHIKLHFTKNRIARELVHHVEEGLRHLESTGMAQAHGETGSKNRFTVLTPLGVSVRNKLLQPPPKCEKENGTVELTATT